MKKRDVEAIITEEILQHKERYYRLAYSYVKNVDDALDIVQEAIYKAITSRGSLKEPTYVKTWFYRIVVNTAVDFLRKHQKIALVDEQSLALNACGSEDIYHNIDLERALASLTPHEQSIILLRYFEDLKLQEVASVLDENLSTVKSRLYAALKKLHNAMEE